MSNNDKFLTKAALNRFGQTLIERVRDRVINESEMVLVGKMKSAPSQKIHQALIDLQPEQMRAIHELLVRVIDNTLHHLLWTFEQEEEIAIAVKTDIGFVPSLRDVSDGLAGELYDWIERFSKKPSSEDDQA